MSTKKTSDQTVKFDQGSKNVFDALQPQVQSNLTNDMQLDPTKSAVYQLYLAQALNSARQQSGNNMQRIAANTQASGIAPGSGFLMGQQLAAGRLGSGLQANAFIQNLMAADARRRAATSEAQGYKPLQTGGTTTESTSGLGTWLPQVVGAGLGMATGAMTGGMSSFGQAAMGGAPSIAGSASGFFNPGSASNGYNFFQPASGANAAMGTGNLWGATPKFSGGW